MDTDDDLGAATVARSVQVLTAISMMAENLARIRQQRAHLRADRDFAAAASRRAEHLAEHGAARAVYGQSGDRQWAARTTVVEAAHTWRVAQHWADLDPAAAMAQRRAEDVLRRHNPTAMARYDVLRAQGADELSAMREAAPLFLTHAPTLAGLSDPLRSAPKPEPSEPKAIAIGPRPTSSSPRLTRQPSQPTQPPAATESPTTPRRRSTHPTSPGRRIQRRPAPTAGGA
jgi:hypothetical protein